MPRPFGPSFVLRSMLPLCSALNDSLECNRFVCVPLAVRSRQNVFHVRNMEIAPKRAFIRHNSTENERYRWTINKCERNCGWILPRDTWKKKYNFEPCKCSAESYRHTDDNSVDKVYKIHTGDPSIWNKKIIRDAIKIYKFYFYYFSRPK